MADAKRIIGSASYKNDSGPCVDFEEFACGHFFNFRAPNDRYNYIGFDNEFHRQHEHRLKRILKEKIHDNEPKIFKVMKSYFHKCVNSDFVRSKGKAEIFLLLSEFGEFPLFNKNWKPSDFNLTKAQNEIEEGKVSLINFKKKAVKDMLHFDLGFSRELTSDIYKDYEKFDVENYKKNLQYDDKEDLPILNCIDEVKDLKFTIQEETEDTEVTFLITTHTFLNCLYPRIRYRLL
ncbi:unnamed protein product [Diamesa hyperborea]